MEESDMDISSDWDMIQSSENGDKESSDDARPSNDVENKTAGSQVEEVADQENVLANDSSSDIDIIDETLEENDISPERMFVPTTWAISPSVGNVSETSPEVVAQTPDLGPPVQAESENSKDAQNENASHETSEESSFTSWRVGGRNVNDWIGFAWEHIQNLTGFQIGSLIGLTFCIYFCITINFIALQEKGNVVSQMEKLVDELRHDNKHLQEKMLSEMKNDKLVSSFEHQIRELKKENSKLNHMLLDVVKVLEQQKDTQEKLLTKRESDYQAPFKKEINKLREHINMLKIDNEELQKQLVRMRYSSYSQGGKHEPEKDRKEHKPKREESFKPKPDHVAPEKDAKEDLEKVIEEEVDNDLPLDILQLKRWNELLDQFMRESGLFDDQGPATGKKGKWNWKEGLKNKLKKPADYVSEFSHLFDSKMYKKLLKDAYKSASDYIADAQENIRSHFESPQDPARNPDFKSNIWSAINGLGKKWEQVKQKIISTYDFDMKECPAGKGESKADSFDSLEPEPSAENGHQGHQYQMPEPPTKSPDDLTQAANEKWFFKRAQLREKLRDYEEKDTKNWFLRRRNLRRMDGEEERSEQE